MRRRDTILCVFLLAAERHKVLCLYKIKCIYVMRRRDTIFCVSLFNKMAYS
jgi:hypothetical protein